MRKRQYYDLTSQNREDEYIARLERIEALLVGLFLNMAVPGNG